jgi:hypothetical protein
MSRIHIENVPQPASHYDHDCGLIRLLVESATFPERQAGTMVEETVVTFTEHFETVAVHR